MLAKMSGPSSSLRFYQKVAIVTGGCDGIGRGCVDVLVENGGIVVVLDIDDDIGTKMTSDGPGEVIYIHCDMRKEDEIKKSIQEVVARCGKIDCLVNNVGIHPGPSKIDDLSVQDFIDLLQMNLISYFTASKYVLPHLRKSKGNIVNISSNCSMYALRNSSTYNATKGGITSLTKSLAIDEGEHGVRVNSIAPGPTNTRMFKELMPIEEREILAKCNHLQRLCTPREVGMTCLFLAVDATYITGEELMCMGGGGIGLGVKGCGTFV